MYGQKQLFEYAQDYFMILPKGIEKGRDVGNGSIVIEDDYIIYFKPDTPNDIKTRLIHDYAEYHQQEKKSGIYR